jgi:hypothetical protein
MRNLKSLIAVGALALAAGCGGGGGSSGSGNMNVLLTDAPLISVNGRTFSELNVDITAFEASVPGTRSFTAIPFSAVGATVTSVNLLDLNNTQEWLAVASLPAGRYDEFRLTIDPTTANLVENGTGAVQPLTVVNPNGQLTFHLMPAANVDPSKTTLIIVDWQANRSVAYDAQSGNYLLSGQFAGFALNRAQTPVPFRALPGRLASVDTTTGDMRLRVERHSEAEYLVRTNIAATNVTPAALLDVQGNAIQITDFHVGDFVIVSGTVDANADIDATTVRQLPTATAQPPGRGGHGRHHHGGQGGQGNQTGNNGGQGGNGNNGGPGNPGPGIVFAHGVIHNLDTTAMTFELDSSYHGTIDVTYGPATKFGDARVRPPQPTTALALANGEEVDVIGLYVAPTTQGGTPSIDATHTAGPGPNGAPGGILIDR